jgi:hypothetical protein
MNSFTRADVQMLRSEIDLALAAVAAKYGLLISLGNCRFSTTEARFSKLTIAPQTVSTYNPTASIKLATNGTDPYGTLESREYLNLGYRFNLPKDGLGKTFRAGGRDFTIIGLKSSRYKYPVTAVGSQGGRYKFTAGQVRNGLVK